MSFSSGQAESPDGTEYTINSTLSICDSHGRQWAIDFTVGGIVTRDGIYMPGISHIDRLLYQHHQVLAHHRPTGHWFVRQANGYWDETQPDPTDTGDAAKIMAALDRLADGQHAVISTIGALTVAVGKAISDLSNKVDHDLGTLASGIEAVQQGIEHVLQLLSTPAPDQTAASVRFVVPYVLHPVTRERITMPVNIIDDAITVIPIEFDNLAGASVPAPSGGTASVSVDNTANFSVAMGADGMSVEVTPVQPPTEGATATITYTDVVNGQTLTATLADLTITQDVQATSVHFRTDQISTKPLPAAPPAGP